jgi:hypothetical protein
VSSLKIPPPPAGAHALRRLWRAETVCWVVAGVKAVQVGLAVLRAFAR